jgi:3'-phosphoadenosine 5'-phosphosulfate sulfotransferase (PAPS reductase)/FAD synthetase
MSKLNDSLTLIEQAIVASQRPAVLMSFGKDSMAMANLIRQTGARGGFPKTHGFPIDVIFHRDPWFKHKNEFADYIAQSWGMEVHDFPPMAAGVKVKHDMIELVSRYHFGNSAIDIPKNVCAPHQYPRRDYICGLNDWVLRPKTFLADYPWDTVFMGHRDADVDPFEGAVPLGIDETNAGGVRLLFPIRSWTDAELWDYIESEHIPVQETRYDGRWERTDKWYNNDYVHACTACIDPRETRESVYCPKLQVQVKNRGAEVAQLHERPPYLKMEVT